MLTALLHLCLTILLANLVIQMLSVMMEAGSWRLGMSNFAEDELNNFGFAGGIEEKPSSASAANTCTFFIVIKKCTALLRGVVWS